MQFLVGIKDSLGAAGRIRRRCGDFMAGLAALSSRKPCRTLESSDGRAVQRVVPFVLHSMLYAAMNRFLLLALLSIVSQPFCPSACAAGREEILYSFQGIPDGEIPVGGVVFDNRGDLYGATTDGGSSACNSDFQCGTVYKMTERGGVWHESVLHVFKGNRQGGDGASPFGGLIVDSANNLYGTTGYGGTGHCVLLGDDEGCGIVFELIPPPSPGGKWTYTVLYSFKGGEDGYLPMGNLVFDSSGNLYGATFYGGGFGICNQNIYPNCGTVFELSPPKTENGKWSEKVLYSFKSGSDGANPNGSFAFDRKGNLYGTTFFGGNQNCKQDAGVGCGTAFKLTAPLDSNGSTTTHPGLTAGIRGGMSWWMPRKIYMEGQSHATFRVKAGWFFVWLLRK
jgi:hypothetical protein